MAFKIFAINPGSTSTKVALYEAGRCVFERVIRHNTDELKLYPTASSQFEYRFTLVKKIMDDECKNPESIDAFAGRGGLLRPLSGGTYFVNRTMLDDLKSSKYGDHASNLGAIIAAMLGELYGKPAYIVNPVVVDEMMDVARYTGLPEIKRMSVFHALNQKAAAIRAAAEMGVEYEKARFIVAHLGGGISVGAHDCGRVIDVNNALEEGPFSPERSGSLPVGQLVELCFSGRYSREEIKKMLVGKGGLSAYTGTTDFVKLENESKSNEKVKKLLDAFVYMVSKEICASSAALFGKIDRVIITGGLAYSSLVVEGIRTRVSFLGPVEVYPGEDELAALAQGATWVLEGREQALEY